MSRDDPQSGVLDRIVKWAAAEELVRAVVLTSTRASPHAKLDRFSDYDVILYVADAAPLTSHAEWLTCVGQVLVCFPDEGRDNGFPYAMRLVIYEDGTKIDFTIAPVERLDELAQASLLPDALDVGYRVLLDKEGRTAALPAPTYTAHIPNCPTQEEFQAVVEEFWFEATYVAKSLWRDELLPAKYSLEAVMNLSLLRRMLEWRIETDHDWALRPGVLGKGLKRQLDETTWAELEETFTGADIDENWQALFHTTRLFRRVATDVAERLNLVYPQELDARMTDYLRQVEALSVKPV